MHACRVSLKGYCPKMSLWQEHVPCEGWLYHVWIPETLAHVYYSDAWNDQPNFVYRYAYVYRNANFFLLPIFHCQSLSISYYLSLPKYLLDCHLVIQIVQARVCTKTNYTVRSHRSSSFPWSQVSANAIAVHFRGEKFQCPSPVVCLLQPHSGWTSGKCCPGLIVCWQSEEESHESQTVIFWAMDSPECSVGEMPISPLSNHQCV